MASADLGVPVLMFILLFWALFALAGLVTSFTKRENLREIRQFIRRMTDTNMRRRKA